MKVSEEESILSGLESLGQQYLYHHFFPKDAENTGMLQLLHSRYHT